VALATRNLQFVPALKCRFLTAKAVRNDGNLGYVKKENSRLEPIASVRDPPAQHSDGNRRDERPPQRQHDVSDYAEQRERDPKNLPFHPAIVVAGNVT
jgi:hypothetical protein